MKKEKKVLLVVRWPVGGIRTFMRYVYSRFDPAEWKFSLIAPDLQEVKLLVEKDLAAQHIRYIPVEKNPSAPSFFLKILKELNRNKYDLIHSHGFTSGICTVIPARLYRTRHIMTSHDVINAKQFFGLRGGVKKRIITFLLQRIDTIQSVSNDAQDNLLEYFPALSKNKKRCIVVPNGIEVERFLNAQPRDLRKELALDQTFFLIGFLGRFMSQKGFRYLVDAVELLSKETNMPKKPLIITIGSGGFAAREKRDIENRGLQKYFHHLPFTPNVASTIKGLDVVAMPSLWEACGLLAMETLTAGTPLICSDCIGLREVVQKTPAVKVPSGDAISLAVALRTRINGESDKDSFQHFAQQAALRYNVDKQVTNIKKLMLEEQ